MFPDFGPLLTLIFSCVKNNKKILDNLGRILYRISERDIFIFSGHERDFQVFEFAFLFSNLNFKF